MINSTTSPGTKVKVIANTSGHGRPIGTEGEIARITGTQAYLKGISPWFGINDLALVEETLEDLKESLAKEIKNHEATVTKLKAKIAYMEANGIEKFDEDEYKAFAILSTIDSGLDKMAQAKAIAQLFK